MSSCLTRSALQGLYHSYRKTTGMKKKYTSKTIPTSQPPTSHTHATVCKGAPVSPPDPPPPGGGGGVYRHRRRWGTAKVRLRRNRQNFKRASNTQNHLSPRWWESGEREAWRIESVNERRGIGVWEVHCMSFLRAWYAGLRPAERIGCQTAAWQTPSPHLGAGLHTSNGPGGVRPPRGLQPADTRHTHKWAAPRASLHALHTHMPHTHTHAHASERAQTHTHTHTGTCTHTPGHAHLHTYAPTPA